MTKASELKIGDVILVGVGKPRQNVKVKVVNLIKLPWFQNGSVCVQFDSGETDILRNDQTVSEVNE